MKKRSFGGTNNSYLDYLYDKYPRDGTPSPRYIGQVPMHAAYIYPYGFRTPPPIPLPQPLQPVKLTNKRYDYDKDYHLTTNFTAKRFGDYDAATAALLDTTTNAYDTFKLTNSYLFDDLADDLLDTELLLDSFARTKIRDYSDSLPTKYYSNINMFNNNHNNKLDFLNYPNYLSNNKNQKTKLAPLPMPPPPVVMPYFVPPEYVTPPPILLAEKDPPLHDLLYYDKFRDKDSKKHFRFLFNFL